MKYSILLCLLFIALSFFLPKQNKAEDGVQTNSVSILAAASAFGTFITDIDGFCARNPQSCETGKSLFDTMGDKIHQGAIAAYQWLGTNLSKGAQNTEQQIAAPITKKTTKASAEKLPQKPENTKNKPS